MLIVVGVIITVLLGLCIANLLVPRFSLVERLALGYGIGLAAVTFMLFLLSWAGVPLSPLAGLLPSIAIIVLLSVYRKRLGRALKISGRPAVPVPAARRALDPLETALLAAIALLVGVALLQAAYWPVRAFDGVHLYDNIAKLFYYQKGIILDDYSKDLFEIYVDYPLHVSLSHSWIYLLAGSSDVNPKFLYVMYYVAILAVFYCRSRCRLRRRHALLMTLVLASAPNVFSYVPWCSTTFPYSCYYFMAVIYLSEFMWTGDRGMLVIGTLFLSFLAWIRPASEIIVLGITLVVAYYSLRKRTWYPLILILSLVGIVYGSWAVYIHLMEKPFSLATFAPMGYGELVQWDKLSYVLRKCMVKLYFLSPGYSGIIWYLFVGALLWGVIRKRGYQQLAWIIFLNIGGAFFLFYLIGVQCGFAGYWEYNARNAATRMSPMFVYPLLYYIAVVFFGSLRGKGEECANEGR